MLSAILRRPIATPTADPLEDARLALAEVLKLRTEVQAEIDRLTATLQGASSAGDHLAHAKAVVEEINSSESAAWKHYFETGSVGPKPKPDPRRSEAVADLALAERVVADAAASWKACNDALVAAYQQLAELDEQRRKSIGAILVTMLPPTLDQDRRAADRLAYCAELRNAIRNALQAHGVDRISAYAPHQTKRDDRAREIEEVRATARDAVRDWLIALESDPNAELDLGGDAA